MMMMMMTIFFLFAPLPPGSLFPSILLLVLSSVSLESKPVSQGLSSRILFSLDQNTARSLLGADAATSSARHQRDELNEVESLLPHATERGAEPRVWPHLLLDLMGQQNRFKGRTRKNVRGNGVQDGVVEERWRERIHQFQEPEPKQQYFSIQEFQ